MNTTPTLRQGLGRGTLYLMVAQCIFLASGYIIHAGLGRILGPASYGIFGIVIALLTLTQNLLGTGIPQAASKYIAEDTQKARAIEHETVKLQAIFALLVCSVYLLFASSIATLLGDPSLARYIRISACIIPATAFFTLYTNFLNGLRWYDKQALVIACYSLAKIAGVFALVFVGFAIYGALFGYICGPLVGLALGWYYFQRNEFREETIGHQSVPKQIIISFAVPVIIFSITFTFLISADLFFVKRILGENVQAGYYTAASMLARVPFYILGALGPALFPAIAQSTATNNLEQTENYIAGSMRYLLMLLVPLTLLISATSGGLVTFFYSPAYTFAAPSLRILIFGSGCFTILSILTTVITASGRPRVSLLIALLLVPLTIVLNSLLIPRYQLEGAALATTLTSLIGLSLASTYVLSRFKALVQTRSVIKIAVASLAIYIVALRLSFPAHFLPLLYPLLLALYLLLLVMMKELNRADLETLKRIIPTSFD